MYISLIVSINLSKENEILRISKFVSKPCDYFNEMGNCSNLEDDLVTRLEACEMAVSRLSVVNIKFPLSLITLMSELVHYINKEGY